MKPNLPKNIHYKHGAYYYVKRIGGGAPKWTRLGKSEAEMYRQMAEIKAGEANKGTMNEYFNEYKKTVLPKKAESTQKNNLAELKNLAKVFGHMKPHQITTVYIYRYMDKRALTSKVCANREKATLSNVFTYLIRWGVVTINPCKECESFKETPRTRAIEDWEYNAVYKEASDIIQIAMELASICGMRQGDILSIKLKDITDKGLAVEQNKNGAKQLFIWTPSLRKAITKARELRDVKSFTHLICTKKGKPYSASGFKSMWQRLQRKCKESGVIQERFTFHDLRSYAADNADEQDCDASKLLGHANKETTERIYLRRAKKVTPNR